MSPAGFGGSHRRKGRHAESERDLRRRARSRVDVRRCCSTSWRESHASGCAAPDRCKAKKGISQRAKAKELAAAASADYGVVLSEYQCPSCGLYHLGRPQPGQRGFDGAVS
jgi:hypothetical protein